MSAPLLNLYRRMQRWPAGSWLFSRAVCFKAPYFASIAPRITLLEPGRCEGRIAHRRKVTNQIGTVHAIALCNLAELVGGVMTDASLPKGMRWIPKGMTVEYLKKANTDLVAIATPEGKADWSVAGEYLVKVEVQDKQAETVFRAIITMWVSPKKSS